MLLSQESLVSSHERLNVFRRIYNWAIENPAYVIAIIYLSSAVFETLYKGFVSAILHVNKGTTFFIFTYVGYFFLNPSQSLIGVLSKKLIQASRAGREEEIARVFDNVFWFNIFSCTGFFVITITVNLLFSYSYEGILHSVAGDMPVDVTDRLPWQTEFGTLPILIIVFTQQFFKSLYQPLLAIIGNYKRTTWFATEKIGASALRLVSLMIISITPLGTSINNLGWTQLGQSISLIFVYLITFYGTYDIIQGWRTYAAQYYEQNPSKRTSSYVREVDPFILNAIVFQCAFTFLKTIMYTFGELYTKLIGLKHYNKLLAATHPFSDIWVGMNYVITPIIIQRRQTGSSVVGGYLSLIFWPIIIFGVCVSIDCLSYSLFSWSPTSFISRGGAQGLPQNEVDRLYYFGLFAIVGSFARGISFTFPAFKLAYPNSSILGINYFMVFGYIGAILFLGVVSPFWIFTLIISSAILNVIISILYLSFYEASFLRNQRLENPSFEQ